MIENIYFAIGFLVYVSFCLITFKVYTHKNEITKSLILIFIYLFYTILASYVISFVDIKGTFFEKFIQSIVYAVMCSIVLYYYYQNNIKITEIQVGYGKSPDDNLY